MKTYLVVHTHEYGSSTYLVKTTRDDVPVGDWDPDTVLSDHPTLAQFCEDILSSPFEPERGEYLDIEEFDPERTVAWE